MADSTLNPAANAVAGNSDDPQKSSENTISALASAAAAPLSNLNISRNKHWRFISSYHGQWLQMPHESLESLAYSNYFSPRPHIVDASVLFNVARIKRLVEEATDLCVRAANGTTSSAIGTSLNTGRGRHRGEIKLSAERRSRMRELAVKKLSEAYRLDEIATSVATMQSSSSLEDVAQVVLQRAPHDTHAKYVHFFHEKIPSRTLAESTSLQPLDEALQEFSLDPALLRTRAVTKVLKGDYIGAVKDLTEALASARKDTLQHPNTKSLNVTCDSNTDLDHFPSDHKHEMRKLSDDEKPTGIEAQLHFQRATFNLSLACQSVDIALKAKHSSTTESMESPSPEVEDGSDESLAAYRKVKLNANRALRDFITFLSKLEYSTGSAAKDGATTPTTPSDSEIPEATSSTMKDHLPDISMTTTIISDHKATNTVSDNQPARIYQVSDLFSPTPPTNLPLFPSTSTNPDVSKPQIKSRRTNREMVTYHPLLIEALHGLLLCHALLQTDKPTMEKHAYMVARLVSLSHGHSLFLSSRSASRSDWLEVLAFTKDWIDLNQPWSILCQQNLPGKETKAKATLAQLKALSIGQQQSTSPAAKATPATKQQSPKSPLDLKAYSLGTERAAIIRRWISDAPHLPDAPVKLRKGKKKAVVS